MMPSTGLTNDAALWGEWKAIDDTRLVFQADATFCLGTRNVAYWLEQGGLVLNMNQRTWYNRQSGPTDAIVGRWRDDAEGETLTYGADGHYLDVFDDDPLQYTGTYQADVSTISSFEYRGTWQAASGVIEMAFIFGNVERGSYAIDQTVLTLQLTSGTSTYTRV